MFVRKTKRFARGIDILCAGLTVGLIGPGHFRYPFPDQSVRDDKLRLSVIALLSDVEGVEKSLHVVALDFLDIESVGFEPGTGVFALRVLGRSIERDRV